MSAQYLNDSSRCGTATGMKLAFDMNTTSWKADKKGIDEYGRKMSYHVFELPVNYTLFK
jgi:hypothetical protein